MKPKIVLLDIETAPALAHVYGLFNQNIPHEMIERDPFMLCYTIKVVGEPKIYFDAIWKHDLYKKNPYTDVKLAKGLHKLLYDADIIVGQNSDSFDIKWVNTVIMLANLKPLPPNKSIDTLKISRSKFKFISNKLDYVSKRLGNGGKKKHEGWGLWHRCINGDKKAHKEMQEYNITDIIKTEQMFVRMRPHANNLAQMPNVIDENKPVCVACGKTKFHYHGTYTSKVAMFKRLVCTSCGKWHRTNKNILKKSEKLIGL